MAGLLAAGQFESPLSEYPPSDYRRLVAAAAATYGVRPTSSSSVPGPTRSSTWPARHSFRPAGRAVIPTPSYAMYRVVTEQRGARVVAVPRRPAAEGWAIDVAAVREAARTADLVWLCSPNNPTALAEPAGAIEELLAGLAADAAADGRAPAIVVLDEAYAEFVDATLLPLRLQHPNLIVVRTASKAYALAGLRVGFAIAASATIARIAPYRPPGSVSTVSVTLVTAALLDPTAMRANVARVERERDRLADGLRVGRLAGRAVRHELPPRPVRQPGARGRHRRGAPPPRDRAADVRGGPSTGRLAPADGSRRRRERSADRCRPRGGHGNLGRPGTPATRPDA